MAQFNPFSFNCIVCASIYSKENYHRKTNWKLKKPDEDKMVMIISGTSGEQNPDHGQSDSGSAPSVQTGGGQGGDLWRSSTGNCGGRSPRVSTSPTPSPVPLSPSEHSESPSILLLDGCQH